MKIKKKIFLLLILSISFLTYSQNKTSIGLDYSYNRIALGNMYGLEYRVYSNNYIYGVIKLHKGFHKKEKSFVNNDFSYNMKGRRKENRMTFGLGFNYTQKKHSLFIEGNYGLVHIDHYYKNSKSIQYEGNAINPTTIYDIDFNQTGYVATLGLGYDYNIYSNFHLGVALTYIREFDDADGRLCPSFRLSYLFR